MINLDLEVFAYCSEDLFDDVRQYVNLAAVTKKVNPQTLENLVEDVNKLIGQCNHTISSLGKYLDSWKFSNFNASEIDLNYTSEAELKRSGWKAEDEGYYAERIGRKAEELEYVCEKSDGPAFEYIQEQLNKIKMHVKDMKLQIENGSAVEKNDNIEKSSKENSESVTEKSIDRAENINSVKEEESDLTSLQVEEEPVSENSNELEIEPQSVSVAKEPVVNEIENEQQVEEPVVNEIENEQQVEEPVVNEIENEQQVEEPVANEVESEQQTQEPTKQQTLRQQFDIDNEEDFNRLLAQYAKVNKNYYSISGKKSEEDIKKRRNINAQMKRILNKKALSMPQNENGEDFAVTLNNIESGKVFSQSELQRVVENKAAAISLFNIMASGVYEKDGERIRLTQKQRVALASTLEMVSEMRLDMDKSKNVESKGATFANESNLLNEADKQMEG